MQLFCFKSFVRISLLALVAGLVSSVHAAEMESVGEPASHSWTTPSGPAPVLPRLASPTTPFVQGDLTNYEQYMLEMVNRARANPGAEADRLGIDLNENLAAGTISTNSKPPLASHPDLLTASRDHNQWMFAADIFSHTGLNGSQPGDRMSAAGYSFVYPGGWGENIAWRGTTASSFDLTYFVELLHDGLFKSSGHRKNLMNANFDEVGVGVNTGFFFSDGRDWNSALAAQTFAYSSATPGPLVLGVVFRDDNSNGVYDPGEGVSGITVTPEFGDYYAVSSASGGYAFPYSGNGPLNIEFTGGALVQPVNRSLVRGSTNVKVDLELNSGIPLAISTAALVASPSTYQFIFSGSADQQVQVQRSTDFVNWDVLATYIIGSEPIVFLDNNPPAGQASYRVVVP